MKSSERWIVYPGLLVLGGFTFARQGTQPAAPDAEFGELKVQSLVVRAPDGEASVVIKAVPGGAAALMLYGPNGEAGHGVGLVLLPNGDVGLGLRGIAPNLTSTPG